SSRASPDVVAPSVLAPADAEISARRTPHTTANLSRSGDATVTRQTPFLQLGSSFFLTSMAIEPSGLSGCSHAHATGFNTPGRISNWAERLNFPSKPFGRRNEPRRMPPP